MNVLMVTSGYPPEHSGSGLRLHKTYVRLKRQYPDLSWKVLTRSRGNGRSLADWPGPDAIETFPSPLISHATYAPVQAILEWFEARRWIGHRILDDVHVVHCVGFTWLAVYLCIEARNRGIPVIRELTSVADMGLGHGLGGRWLSVFVRALNKSASLLVSISPHLEHGVRTSGVATPIWCRPNPVNTERFRLPNEEERHLARQQLFRGADWSDDDVVVLHVGHILPNKNQLLLVRALQRLPSRFKLVLVGPLFAEDQPYLEAIRQEVASNGLNSRVFIEASYCKRVDMYMRAADLFVFPSRSEGLGNVMLEAICSGLPTAASYLPGVTDWIIEHGKNGFLFMLTPEDIAVKIAAAAGLCEKKHEIAREAAIRFNFSAIDESYWNHLQTLFNNSARKRVSSSGPDRTS